MNDFTINAFNMEQTPLSLCNTSTSSSASTSSKATSSLDNITINPNPPADPNQPQEQPSIYGEVPIDPLFDAVEGIKYDFNQGIRVLFPNNGKTYHIVFVDIDTDNILYSNDIVCNTDGICVTSVKKYYVKFKLMIYEKDNEKPLFEHEMNLTDKEVMIQFPCGAVGDTIAWFSYVERFQLKHHCKLIVVMEKKMSDLFKDQYPNITFIEQKDTLKYKPYASYYMGLFFKGNVDNQPIDFRYIGLHRTAGYILGLTDKDLEDLAPRVDLSAPRQIKEKYVCIAAQSSSQAKYWNNPFGWISVVKFLKDSGYRVLCIDLQAVQGEGLHWNFIPYGAEDFTGNIPLQERINLIKDADFFIGLSSGLSWVAWCCGVPVVMISGFTHPTNEFYTPYRIINYHACHSCWNDMRENFDHFDFLWCPRHKGDEKHFECSKMISPAQVISAIKKIPTFKPDKIVETENKQN